MEWVRLEGTVEVISEGMEGGGREEIGKKCERKKGIGKE